MRTAVSSILILAGMALAATGHCAPTGLLIIPTAETVGKNTVTSEYQWDAPYSDGSGRHVHLFNNEFGFSSRFEAGVDVDLSSGAEHRVMFDLKFVPLGKPGEKALAFGVYNCGHGRAAIPYLVATRCFRRIRLHLGSQHREGNNEVFWGIDRCLRGKWDISADWTAGKDNFGSIGLTHYISGEFGGQIGIVFPNDSNSDGFVTFHLAWTGPF